MSGRSSWIEAASGAACFLAAAKLGMWMSLPFLYLFVQGYAYMLLLSVFPVLGRGTPTPAPQPQG